MHRANMKMVTNVYVSIHPEYLLTKFMTYVLVMQPALWNLLVNEWVTEVLLRHAIYVIYRNVPQYVGPGVA